MAGFAGGAAANLLRDDRSPPQPMLPPLGLTLGQADHDDAAPTTATAALATLLAGNQRFVDGTPRHPHELQSFRMGLSGAQHPFATILSCSDSRVPPELLFDEGFGDLFVVRVAGNIVDTDVTGSIEYAVSHLHTPLLVVMGHEDCGAVTAALKHFRGELGAEPPEILALLGHIEPGLDHVSATASLADQVPVAVEDNVHHSVHELLAVPFIRRAVASGHLRVVGTVYDLDTGLVRVLP